MSRPTFAVDQRFRALDLERGEGIVSELETRTRAERIRRGWQILAEGSEVVFNPKGSVRRHVFTPQPGLRKPAEEVAINSNPIIVEAFRRFTDDQGLARIAFRGVAGEDGVYQEVRPQVSRLPYHALAIRGVDEAKFSYL